MENDLKKIHARINELNNEIKSVSQYALIISNRLTAHDRKLDIILSKLTLLIPQLPETSKTHFVTEKRSSSERTHPISKPTNPSDDSQKITFTKKEESLTELKKKEKEISEPTTSGATNKRSSSVHGSLPFNLSTPSIPQLRIENNDSQRKKIKPCKSNPAIVWNESETVGATNKKETINVYVTPTDSKDHGASESGAIRRTSSEKLENAKLTVRGAYDECQANKSCGDTKQLESDVHNKKTANEKSMLGSGRNLDVNKSNERGATSDKKRANSTTVSPTLDPPTNHQRRSSYAGMTVNQTHKAGDMAPVTTSKKIETALTDSFLKSEQPLNQNEVCSKTKTSIFDVQRQTSTSSTATTHSGIDIIMGDDSELDDDEIEIKLAELPKPIFSHRSVTVKKSTYKHFYDLKEPIGGGRFGRVYRCVEKKTGLVLAAKCFQCKKEIAQPLLKAKSLQRAQNLKTKRTQQEPVDKSDVLMEIAIMNQIDHHNIVKLYDAYDNDNTMTLIMEYLGGGELFERVIADQSQLTELDAVLFMKQIITAVQYLHKNLILHLDLKPENILCLDRSTHHLKIIDFGLARKHQPRQKLIVQWGTPEFMAPEMLNYGTVSFPSDMWSLGIICYILLSGISPFLGESDTETMNNIVDCEWDFDEEPFEKVSEEGKDFISRLLVEEKSGRMSAAQCLRHEWLATPITNKRRKALMNKSQLKSFMARMQWKASVAALTAANWLKQKVTSVTDNVLSRDTTV